MNTKTTRVKLRGCRPFHAPRHLLPAQYSERSEIRVASASPRTRACGCILELRSCEHGRARGPKPSGNGRNADMHAAVSFETKRFIDEGTIKPGEIVEAVVKAAQRRGVPVATILAEIG